MKPSEPALTAEDHAYRHAADAYFAEKGKLARATFDEKLCTVFLSFEEHWHDFFAPREELRQREYLATPFEVRKAQFERFRRECRAWEVNFRHCTKRQINEPRPGNGAGSDWSDLKRRLEAQRERTQQVRDLYDSLDGMLDRERQRRSHPVELLVHVRALGLPSDATLEDIKKQYKRLAKMHHPDRRTGDATKMSRINNAYGAIMSFYRVVVAGS